MCVISKAILSNKNSTGICCQQTPFSYSVVDVVVDVVVDDDGGGGSVVVVYVVVFVVVVVVVVVLVTVKLQCVQLVV